MLSRELAGRVAGDEKRVTDLDYRTILDRRCKPTGPLDAFRLSGRRGEVRRASERLDSHFLDHYDAFVLALIVSILALTVVDGMFTIELLSNDCEEANPVMKYMLHHGFCTFFAAKYVLTAIGLPFLLVFKNHFLFGSRFRVGYVFPVFLMLYLILVGYEVHLLERGRTRTAEPAGIEAANVTERAVGFCSRLDPRQGKCGLWSMLTDFTAPDEVVRRHPEEAGVGLE